jgi:hypothetical protein
MCHAGLVSQRWEHSATAPAERRIEPALERRPAHATPAGR